MYLTILDLILLLILFVFVAFGFTMGLFEVIGGLVGILVGAWAAGHYYQAVADWLSFLPFSDNAVRVIAFILIFTLANRLFGLVFYFINKIFKIFLLIPFSKMLNRILGAIFGLIEGIFALGLILYFASRFSFSATVDAALSASQIAGWLVWAAGLLAPLLPLILRQLKSVIF